MRRAKVLVSDLSCKNGNKIFHGGLAPDVVSENDVENFDALIKGKYIEEVEKDYVSGKENDSVKPAILKERDDLLEELEKVKGEKATLETDVVELGDEVKVLKEKLKTLEAIPVVKEAVSTEKEEAKKAPEAAKPKDAKPKDATKATVAKEHKEK